MANEEQLSILKQGVDVWNKWRSENSIVKIDLSGSNLSFANLQGANLQEVNLSQSIITNANLKYATLVRADLRRSILASDLGGAILGAANLSDAYLNDANLSGANLQEANLSGVDFSKANLSNANLSRSELTRADFRYTVNLCGTNFEGAEMSNAVFGSVDLSEAYNLKWVRHLGPSTVGFNTIRKSKGKIPEKFLRGCGLNDWEIESAKLYFPDLTNEEIIRIQYRIYDLRATQALQISPLFISYSHADTAFVEKMDKALIKKGIRFWRDIHDMKSGRMEKQIDRAMRLNPTVLLILSEHSLQSDWVEHEVRTARALEKEMGKDILCPVALDDSWKDSPWSVRLMEQVMEYNILDFSSWKDDEKFGNIFTKLIDGLGLFYK